MNDLTAEFGEDNGVEFWPPAKRLQVEDVGLWRFPLQRPGGTSTTTKIKNLSTLSNKLMYLDKKTTRTSQCREKSSCICLENCEIRSKIKCSNL